MVDILPIQLQNLARKLPADERVALLQGDSSALACPDASYDQVLLFFLLHEQPEAVRRATLAEALRVVRPGGKIVIVDYHRPVRAASAAAADDRRVPQARALCDGPVGARGRGVPARRAPAGSIDKHTYFGGLYQKLVLIRAEGHRWTPSRPMSRSSAPAAPACARPSPWPKPTRR